MRFAFSCWLFLLIFCTNEALAQCASGDCINGHGVFKFSNGAKYEGQFKEGMRHGTGTFYYPNGDVYSGKWAFRFPDGEGKMTYADGTSSDGYWKKGNFLGEQPPETEERIATSPTITAEKDVLTAKGQEQGVKRYGESVYEVGKKIDPGSVKGTKVYAVVVGISDYTVMPRLSYTDDDAYQVYAFLKSPEGGALPDDQIRILIDQSATKSQIEKTMHEVYGQADEDDVVMLYFSGHGLKGAFLPIDYTGKTNRLDHATVIDILEKSPAKYKFCIADACHSGSIATRSMSSIDMTIKTFYDAFQSVDGGTALLLSSKSDEISLESKGLRQGVFSHFLIRGMKGEADSNRDKIVTVQELYRFVADNVTDFTGAYQSPMLKGDYDKNMPVGVIRY